MWVDTFQGIKFFSHAISTVSSTCEDMLAIFCDGYLVYIKGLLTSIVTNPSKWRVDICNIAVGTHQMFWFYWSISLWGALMVLPSVIFTAGRYLLGVKLLYVGV